MLAECHVVEHQYDEAAGYLRRLVEVNPTDDQAARRLIELHFEKTGHELTLAREAIQQAGETPDLAFRMGCLLQARGDYDDAARWFRRVPRQHPLANRAFIQSGTCRLALNQGHLATAAFKAALGNEPANEDRCAALYHLGMAYSRLLDFERAGQAFEELCVLNPDYEDAARQLQACQEQLATGEKMRLAEVPFDLLTAWRDATAKTGPIPQPASTPPVAAPVGPVPSVASPRE
jgi:tetratricopeptide (TPR) repeat protein